MWQAWRHGSVGHNDIRPFPAPVAVAKLTLGAPALRNATRYNLTQNIVDGTAHAEIEAAGGGVLRLVAWVEPENNTFGLRLGWDGTHRPLTASVTVSTAATICTNSSIDGPTGRQICAPGSTVPVLAAAGTADGGTVAWVKRMASFPLGSYNLTAATATRFEHRPGGQAERGAAPPAPPPGRAAAVFTTVPVVIAPGIAVSALTTVVTSRDLDRVPAGEPPRGSNIDPLPAALRRLAGLTGSTAAEKSMALAVSYQRRSWNTSCVSLPEELRVLERYWFPETHPCIHEKLCAPSVYHSKLVNPHLPPVNPSFVIAVGANSKVCTGTARYGAVYSMGAASRRGKYPPGLWGPWTTDDHALSAWHGDYTL